MTELNERKLYDIESPNKSTGIVNGKSSNVLNWDDTRFSWVYPMYKSMLGNFWTPFEINMTNDVKQWQNEMSDSEKETFSKIIGLLAFLDSVQTDYSAKISDYLTDSSLCALMSVLSFQEVVHNQSYSYVLSSLVPKDEQDKIFEFWKHDEVLLKRNNFIAQGYEEFTEKNPSIETFLKSCVYDVILEGLFFYAGFAFFYDLARQGKMVATSQMINYINRDEQIHVRLFTKIYREVLNENPTMNTKELEDFVYNTFERAVQLEVDWGDYIIGNKFAGIDSRDLEEYIKHTANTRLQQLGYQKLYPNAKNTMRWIKYFEDIDNSKQDFFEGKSRQYTKTDDDNGFDEL